MTLRPVCAWCQPHRPMDLLGQVPLGAKVSHSICKACNARFPRGGHLHEATDALIAILKYRFGEHHVHGWTSWGKRIEAICYELEHHGLTHFGGPDALLFALMLKAAGGNATDKMRVICSGDARYELIDRTPPMTAPEIVSWLGQLQAERMPWLNWGRMPSQQKEQ